MAYKVGGNPVTLDGNPYLWGSADITSSMTQTTTITTSGIVRPDQVAVGYNKIVITDWGDAAAGNNTGAIYIYNTDGTDETKVTASDAAGGDRFGYSVAIGCGKIVVGAPQTDQVTNGAVYVYNLDGSNEIKITASDGAGNDRFGWSVAVGNGKIVVGAPADDDAGISSGSAYIYDLDGTNEIKITASDAAAGDEFGAGVAIGCGRIVVTAPENYGGTAFGVAYIYDLLGNEIAKYVPIVGGSARTFGDGSNSVAINSGRICIGNYNYNSGRGIAYLVDLDGNEITTLQVEPINALDFFGENVRIGSGRILISCHLNDDNGLQSGSVLVYDLNGNLIQQINGSSGQYYGTGLDIKNGIAVVQTELASEPVYVYSTPQVYTVWDAIDLQYG